MVPDFPNFTFTLISSSQDTLTTLGGCNLLIQSHLEDVDDDGL